MAVGAAAAGALSEALTRPAAAGVQRAQPAAVRIAALTTATPPHRVAAEQVAQALPRIWPHLERRLGPVLRQQAGGSRHFARTLDEMATGLPLGAQTARYAEVALDLVAEAAAGALLAWGGDPADGFVLPGLDAGLVGRLGLRADLVRMPFAHLGCSGGAAGLARAAEWVRSGAGRAALVAAVELPSLTFRPQDTSLDNLLSALVFGDGAGAAVLELAAGGRRQSTVFRGVEAGRPSGASTASWCRARRRRSATPWRTMASG